MERYNYLAHHGTKGQKWGVRRFQNADGTLTDEGRRHYGYGSRRNRPITDNTVDRVVQGAKIGRKIGSRVHSASLGLYAALAVTSIGVGPAGAIGAAAIGGLLGSVSGSISGSVAGAQIGLVAGAIETRKGRKYIEKHDEGLADFEKREKASS